MVGDILQYERDTYEEDELEEDDNQRKKDKDDSSNVSLSGNPKQFLRKNNKYEQMSKNVDKHVDTDTLRKPSNEVTPNDGCRNNPQDCSGQANVANKEDTNKSVLPADFKSRTHRKCDDKYFNELPVTHCPLKTKQDEKDSRQE